MPNRTYLINLISKKTLFLAAILCITVILTPKQNVFAKNSKVFIVAKVNNQIITNVDLDKRFNFFVKTSNIKISSTSEKLFILKQLTQKLIEEKLQFLAAKNLKVVVDEVELNKALESIANSQGKTDKQVKLYFKRSNIPYSEYVNQIKMQLLWKKIVNKLITPRIKITKSEVDEMLELQKISKKTNFHLAEIFIPFNNKKESSDSLSLANKLILEINNGGDFKNIARQFSRSSSSKFDGEIGWIEESSMDPKIYKEINNIKIGEISKAIKINDGYYIFKIIDKKIVSNIKEDEEKRIKSLIFNKKLKIAAKSYLNDLRKKAYIRISS